MRGCLSVVVLGLAFLAAIVWVAGPPVASAIVATTVSRGLAADRLEVAVTADPPLKLALGRADRVAIRATGARWNGVRLGSLDVTLGIVDLVGRTATSADGRLDGVELDTVAGRPVVADVEFSGSAPAAATTVRIDAANVVSVAIGALEAHFGVRPSSVSLAVPDSMRLVLGGRTLGSKLSLGADGSVVAVANGDTMVLFAPSHALPLRVTSLTVASSGLELRGMLDIGALLR